MCHSDASRPPAAEGAVPAASDRALGLTSRDGTRLLAHEGRPATPNGVGVVVMPDVRGLHEYYRQLAVRFAEIGAEAVAIDYFGRTATDDDRSEAFEFLPHVQQTTPEGVSSDVAAGVAHLRELGATRLFTVGFCFGGGYSWRQSADTDGLAGAIGFYGRPSVAAAVGGQLRARLLMLAAGADAATPVTDVTDFADYEQECARAWRVIEEFTRQPSGT